jgi:glycosyltransferase involved in cell wall biosynthesis
MRVIMKTEFKHLLEKRQELENLAEVTFFIPCHNEDYTIIAVLNKIISIATDLKVTFELLVYNDGSTDKTKELVESYAREHSEILIQLVNNNKRKGLGYNYIDGAFRGVGKYYVMMCGDNSETEESIRKILEKKGTADMIIPYFGSLDSRTFFRRHLSRIFTTIVNLISGYHLKYYNGVVLHERFNVMRWHPVSSGFAYQAELLVILLSERKSYVEVLVSNNDREKGASKAFNLKNIFSVTHSLLQIFFLRIRRMIWPA